MRALLESSLDKTMTLANMYQPVIPAAWTRASRSNLLTHRLTQEANNTPNNLNFPAAVQSSGQLIVQNDRTRPGAFAHGMECNNVDMDNKARADFVGRSLQSSQRVAIKQTMSEASSQPNN